MDDGRESFVSAPMVICEDLAWIRRSWHVFESRQVTVEVPSLRGRAIGPIFDDRIVSNLLPNGKHTLRTL